MYLNYLYYALSKSARVIRIKAAIKKMRILVRWGAQFFKCQGFRNVLHTLVKLLNWHSINSGLTASL